MLSDTSPLRRLISETKYLLFALQVGRKTPAGQAPHAGEISAGHLADGQNNPHAPIAEFNTKI
jgi:hypothetical protein